MSRIILKHLIFMALLLIQSPSLAAAGSVLPFPIEALKQERTQIPKAETPQEKNKDIKDQLKAIISSQTEEEREVAIQKFMEQIKERTQALGIEETALEINKAIKNRLDSIIPVLLNHTELKELDNLIQEFSDQIENVMHTLETNKMARDRLNLVISSQTEEKKEATLHEFIERIETVMQILETKKVFQEINRDIQNGMNSIISSQMEEERETAAQNLIEKMDSYHNYQPEEKFRKLESLAQNETRPTYFRLIAIDTLGENIFPNTWIENSLNLVLVDDDFSDSPLLIEAAKNTLTKLKEEVYPQTGEKFSELLSYNSQNINRTAALIWLAIYEHHPYGRVFFIKLFSSDEKHRRISLPVAREIQQRNSALLHYKDVRQMIRRHINAPPNQSQRTQSKPPLRQNNSSEDCSMPFRSAAPLKHLVPIRQ